MKLKKIAVSLFTLLLMAAVPSYANIITTAKSGYFSCAIAGDGPYCWGNNYAGSLGTGSTTPAQSAVALPVAFSNAAAVTSISAGDTFVCAIKDGAVYCWGTNNGAQLGLGGIDYQPHPTPTLIPSLSSGVTEIAAGGAHACAIQYGVVKCWGQNGYGQIGNGTAITASSPAAVLNINIGDAPRNLTAGYFHTCVVKGSTGALFCWGSGMQGELGNGGTADANVPSAVSGLQSDVSVVSAGYAHTCAVQSGQAYCWGKNNVGQLGIGTTSSFEAVPHAVAHPKMRVTSLAMGTYHDCLTNTDGALYCWGQNAYGALAHPTLSSSSVPIPVAVGGYASVGAVTANQSTTCAWSEHVLEEGDRVQAHCWGMGNYGQLGNGSFQSTHVPQRVLSLGGENQVPGGDETQ
ncbi:MAG TPA: chromosome condensation regulator RCC1 [Thermoanaerobaculia bacterium]|nr:chromosome condensation regulator RCC1 [Thermoanaerobaculia bacterium]